MRYDYERDLRITTARLDWLREQYIAAQHHECFSLLKSIEKEIEEAENILDGLRKLR